MKEFKISLNSKSDYLRILKVCNENNIKFKANGDDWNCKFEITYYHSKEIIIDKYNRLFIGDVLYKKSA